MLKLKLAREEQGIPGELMLWERGGQDRLMVMAVQQNRQGYIDTIGTADLTCSMPSMIRAKLWTSSCCPRACRRSARRFLRARCLGLCACPRAWSA